MATNWQIATPDGTYQLTTEFNLKMPEQRDRVVVLVSRFMVWKLATSFVLTAVGWPGPEFKHGGEEAILSVGVSRHDRMGLVQRIRKRDPITFTSPEWLKSDQLDEAYSTLLPERTSEITAEEIESLTSIFGDGGEMHAELIC